MERGNEPGMRLFTVRYSCRKVHGLTIDAYTLNIEAFGVVFELTKYTEKIRT